MINIKCNVYVIIVTYNGEKWIKKCIDSLICSDTNIKIVIVDNASTDGSIGIINGYSNGIKVFRLTSNIGFGKANNVGIGYALSHNADYVLLFNQDAMVLSDMISCLIKISTQYPEYGILSPMHYNYEGTRLDPGFLRYCPPDLLNDAFCGNLKEIYETEMVNAAAWLLKGELLHSVGGFDPLFFHGGEDDDYVKRTRYFGYKVGLVPKSKIFHSHESFGLKHEYTISEICNKQYNSCVLNFKNPDYNICYSFSSFIVKLIIGIIVGIITFDYEKLKIKAQVALRVFTRINTIIRHRKMLIKKIAIPMFVCVEFKD